MTNTATTYSVGQLVRDIGHSVNVAHGSIGQVKGYHHILTNCPVVWFPRGTFGPHDTFVITRPDTDLEPVEPCQCKNTTMGTWYGKNHDAGCAVA